MSNTPGLRIYACIGDKFANIMNVYINGKPYEYRPRSDAESTAKRVNNMAVHSAGKALQWVKKNCSFIGEVKNN